MDLRRYRRRVASNPLFMSSGGGGGSSDLLDMDFTGASSPANTTRTSDASYVRNSSGEWEELVANSYKLHHDYQGNVLGELCVQDSYTEYADTESVGSKFGSVDLTRTAAAATAPNGETEADLFEIVDGTNRLTAASGLWNSASLPAQAGVYSIFLKPVSGSLTFGTDFTGGVSITDSGSELESNGFTRYWWLLDDLSLVTQLRLENFNGDFYQWWPSVTNTTILMPLVSATTSSVTVAADSLRIDSAALSGLTAGEARTYYYKGYLTYRDTNRSTQAEFFRHRTSASHEVRAELDAGSALTGRLETYIDNGTTLQTNNNNSPLDTGIDLQANVAVGYDADGSRVLMNGGAEATGSPIADPLPDLTSANILLDSGGSDPSYNIISSVKIVAGKDSEADMQTETA
jgi:hypothetical protein